MESAKLVQHLTADSRKRLNPQCAGAPRAAARAPPTLPSAANPAGLLIRLGQRRKSATVPRKFCWHTVPGWAPGPPAVGRCHLGSNNKEEAMYQHEVVEHASHKFPNNEVFVATADIQQDNMKVVWGIPKILKSEFERFADSLVLNDYCSAYILEAVSVWFGQTLNLESHSIKIDIAVYFEQIEGPIEPISGIAINRFGDHSNIRENKLSKAFFDANQICVAVIENSEIVSVAFDNGNGAVTVGTDLKFRNRGYATRCLKGLMFEYSKLHKLLGYGTTMDNVASRRVAEKAGLKESGNKGYWIRVDPKIGEELVRDHEELFD